MGWRARPFWSLRPGGGAICRGRGLATACGARLILDCLERGLYPNWDAHDSRSLHLAEKLGYRLDHPYRAYWVEEKART